MVRRRGKGRRTPLPGRSAHCGFTRPSAPFSWSSRSFNGTRSGSAGRYRRQPHGQFRGKMPGLMSMRPPGFRLPGDSIDRARFSAGRAGPFMKEMVGELSRCPTNPFDQDQCINFDQDQCINGRNVLRIFHCAFGTLGPMPLKPERVSRYEIICSRRRRAARHCRRGQCRRNCDQSEGPRPRRGLDDKRRQAR